MKTPLLACLVLLLAGGLVAVDHNSRAAEPPAPESGTDIGSVGDGQTDASAALQRAADRGGAIRLPRGVYRLTRTVRIDLDRSGVTSLSGDGVATLRMEGPGPALQFIGTHAGSADPKTVKDNVWLRQRTPLVDGLEIVGAHPDSIGLSLEGCMQPVVTRCTVRKALHGVVLTGRNRNVIVADCHLYENAGAGLLLEKLNLHQVNVTNCHISYNRGGGIVVRASEIRNLQIGTCDIEANMAAEGPAAANVLLDTTEGSIREGAITGCTLQHAALPADGANIRLLGRPDPPWKVGYFSIGHNQISDTGINIHLRHARGVAITGNTFFLGHQHGVLAENCAQLVLSGNLFERNPDYGKGGSGDGLVFADCRDCTLGGTQLFSTAQPEGAVVLKNCARFNITGCTILDCAGCGVRLENAEHVRVSDCLIRDDRQSAEPPLALRLLSGRGNMIVDNLLGGRVEIAPGTGLVERNYDGNQ